MKVPKKNNWIRLKIAEMVYRAGDGHIPSAYSIVEILSVLYGIFLRFKKGDPSWPKRDYFILSKGHGGTALYVLLEKYGFITDHDLETENTPVGILGGHPDWTKIPGVEASTGSLGHGLPISLGIALGLRIDKKPNRVITLIGDGESNEGTIWESALVAAHLKLGNLLVIADNNGSTAQVLPVPQMRKKWQAFGWKTCEIDGHNEKQLTKVLKSLTFSSVGLPKIIIANTLKGKGIKFMEGHGIWHSKVPNKEEMELIRKEFT